LWRTVHNPTTIPPHGSADVGVGWVPSTSLTTPSKKTHFC
jgi:hypothetical protein